MTVPFLTASGLPARHGFFTREGGVSTGAYAALNASLSGGDDRAAVLENRARAARALRAEPARLVGLTQVHGAAVVTVEQPWLPGEGPRADAMVTAVPGIGLGVITADCAPVLFADAVAGVVGAAHAGWRGALAGVLEATVDAMVVAGARADRIAAAVGPCIHQDSYEVGADLRDAVLTADGGGARFFVSAARPGHWLFDLPGYCAARLARLPHVEVLDVDTRTEDARFWSHRRRTLAAQGGTPAPIGHQLSLVVG